MNIPEFLQENGLSKTFLVRKESIHFKHILTVLFDTENKFYFNITQYMVWYTKAIRKLYNIDREYKYSINKILSTKKDKFHDYIKLFISLNPILYLDSNLSYHFKENIKNEFKDIKIIETTLDLIPLENENLFNFIISNEESNLDMFWIHNYKTYFYKNKRIKNYSLYE